MLSTRELERQISEICQHIPILGTDSVPDLLFPFYVKIRRTVPIFTQPTHGRKMGTQRVPGYFKTNTVVL